MDLQISNNTEEQKLFLSYEHTKNLQAIAAIGIVFHHMAQKTCAPWLDKTYIRHGLYFFLPIGYLLVAIFFFSSGYGLYKSYHSKENYLKGFVGRHFTPIILVYIFSFVCFFLYGDVSNPYSWYVNAILYLYLSFFVAFRFWKNENIRIGIIALFTVIYCVICDLLVLGGWWVNTVGLFTVGLIIAKNEDRIYSIFSSKKVLIISTSVMLFTVSFVISEYLNNHLVDSIDYTSYTVSRILVIILQFIASLCFICMLLVISTRIQLKNRILAFVGSMTLELYLIHGFFVQLFGFSFVNDKVAPLYYIKNVFVYAVVVFICSLLSAALLHLIQKKIMVFITHNRSFFDSVSRGAVKVILVLFGIVIAFSIILMFIHKSGLDEINQKLTAYQQENIVFADVQGKKMAFYIAGIKNSDHTIVVLRNESDPCPSLTMKALCTDLQDEYRIVVPDYLGVGFSDDPASPRTIENITEEIHTGLQNIGIDGPYILMPINLSGVYAQYYTKLYPDEVEMVVGVDAVSFESIEKECKASNISIFEYVRMRNRSARSDSSLARTIDILGYCDYLWPAFEQMYVKGLNSAERELAKELFFRKTYNQYTLEEINLLYDNLIITKDIKYPEGMNVIDIVSTYDEFGNVKDHSDLMSTNSMICENASDHIVREVVDTWYCICYNSPTIKKILDESVVD